MEHIIQIGVSIDDKAIEDRVIKAATDEVLNLVKKTAAGGSVWDSNGFIKELMKEEVKRLVDDNKAEIIANATKELARNMTNTKAVKEAVAKAVEEFQEVGCND